METAGTITTIRGRWNEKCCASRHHMNAILRQCCARRMHLYQIFFGSALLDADPTLWEHATFLISVPPCPPWISDAPLSWLSLPLCLRGTRVALAVFDRLAYPASLALKPLPCASRIRFTQKNITSRHPRRIETMRRPLRVSSAKRTYCTCTLISSISTRHERKIPTNSGSKCFPA